MTPLEKTLELACVDYAQKLGCIGLKLIDRARKGFPDRSFFLPNGKLLLVEFKRPGEKPSPQQIEFHKTLSNLGFPVHLIDSFDSFRDLFKYE